MIEFFFLSLSHMTPLAPGSLQGTHSLQLPMFLPLGYQAWHSGWIHGINSNRWEEGVQERARGFLAASTRTFHLHLVCWNLVPGPFPAAGAPGICAQLKIIQKIERRFIKCRRTVFVTEPWERKHETVFLKGKLLLTQHISSIPGRKPSPSALC